MDVMSRILVKYLQNYDYQVSYGPDGPIFGHTIHIVYDPIIILFSVVFTIS